MSETEIPDPASATIISDNRQCLTCGKPFASSAMSMFGREVCRKLHCDPCCLAKEESDLKAWQEKHADAANEAIRQRIEKLCPPLYASEFDQSLAIAAIKKSRESGWKKSDLRGTRRWGSEMEADVIRIFQLVINFPYSPKGLGIIGESGLCKTRLMFQLLRRYVRERRVCEYLNMAVFGREVGARFGRDAVAGNDWINRLCRIDVLFLDDIGKEKMTERVETELYSIVETRAANLLPIYFTANFKGDKLIAKMKDSEGEISDRAIPIVRRLKEFCEGVSI